MIITPESHLDHGLTPDQIAHILMRFASREAFFIETIELPPDLGEVPCALYGPCMGDAPIAEAQCFRDTRGTRPGSSRILTGARSRPTRKVTVIAGPHEDIPCILYTAFGGPAAPREPSDPSLKEPPDIAESEAFWAEHALAELP